MDTLLPEELTEYATEYGIAADVAQRDYVAVRVAHAIAGDSALAGQVALKGGFVLRYGYGSGRTSKDIDGTIGTRHAALDSKRLQRTVRGQCADLDLRFDPRNPEIGVDSLDFGNLEYTGPLGPGFLTLEMSFREDLIVPARPLKIDAFGVPSFTVRALAVDEMIAEKWRCLVQRSPRRPGDPYDLWFLWADFRTRPPRTADDIIDSNRVRRLVPRKVDLHDGSAEVAAALQGYARVWPAAVGEVLPSDAPGFAEVERAVLEAAREWTPWK
jgi:predicted nucleotidyltransferase component of viral defense system